MKKSYLLLTALLATFILVLLPSQAFAANKDVIKNKTEVKKIHGKNDAFDVLDTKLKKGQIYNDKHTKSKVYNSDKATILEVNQVLSETYTDEKLEKKEAVVVQEISVDADALKSQKDLDNAIEEALEHDGKENKFTNLVASLKNANLYANSGNKGYNNYDSTKSVLFRVAIYYDEIVRNGDSYFLLKSINYRSVAIDSSFILTKMESTYGYYGPGYTYSNGSYNFSLFKQKSANYNITSPVSERTYTKVTNFNYYTQDPAIANSNRTGVEAKLYYKRGTATYSLKTSLVARSD